MPTLFGDVTVTRIFGRIGGFEKRLAPIECGNLDEALRLAKRFVEKRLRRGYLEQIQ
jgi:hypothetical protein